MTDPNPAQNPAPRPILTTLWCLGVAAVVGIATTWIVSPSSPSRFYRTFMLAVAAVGVVTLVVPPLRRAAAGLIGRVRRPVTRIGLSILLTFGLAEGALRLLARGSDSPLFAPIDATAATHLRHWRARPHTPYQDAKMNSLGYFDDEFQVERRAGTHRIVALADSFGTGVVRLRENYLTRLESRLGEARPTEVLNFGVPAIAPADYLYLWRTEARRYDPDLVLVSFFVGNDFDVRKRRSILHADSSMVITVIKRIAAARGVANAPDERAPGGSHINTLGEEDTFTEEAYLALERARLRICRKEPGRSTRRRYESTFRVLTEMHDVIGEKLRLVIIPDEYQVNDALFAQLAGDEPDAFDRAIPQRRLAEFLRTRGIPFLDLTPALRAAESEGSTYKPRDTHWNARGNAVAARAIADWLLAP